MVLKVIEIILASRLVFLDSDTNLLIVNEEDITRRFYRKLLPADLMAILPLWLMHYFLQEQLMSLTTYVRLLCDTVLLSLPIWIDFILMQSRFFNLSRQEQPISSQVKMAKFLAKFVVVFLSIVLFCASFWMAVGCLEHNFHFAACREDSWVYITHHTHNINSKAHLFLTSVYFVLNLAGAGRGDIVAHNKPEMAYVTLAIFIMSFCVAYIQAHVFTMVYKFTMRGRIFNPMKSEMKSVLKRLVGRGWELV